MASGVVSNSDEQHYQRQQEMRHQMQMDYNDHVAQPGTFYNGHQQSDRRSDGPRPSPQMSPRRPVYYRMGTPERGLPIGHYEEQRKVLDDERQRDLNRYLRKKEEKENRERDLRRQENEKYYMQQSLHPYDKPLYNYEEEQKRLRRERQKDYDEFLKIKEEQARYKPAPTPPGGGLPVGGYDRYRKQLKEQLVKEFRDSLKKKEHGSPPRQVTPPSGLPISTEEERQRRAKERQKAYAHDLQKQKEEQLMNRAQHQIEIPVLDRRDQHSQPQHYDNGPPPPLQPPLHHPDDYPPRRHYESYRPSAYDQDAVPRSPQRGSSRDRYRDQNELYDLPLDSYKANDKDKLRKQEMVESLNDYLLTKRKEEKRKQQKLEEQMKQPAAQPKLGNYYDHEQHEKYAQSLKSQRRQDYQDYMAKKTPRNPVPPLKNLSSLNGDLYGLPLSQRPYDEQKMQNEKQRNREYNEFLAKTDPEVWRGEQKRRSDVPRRNGADPSQDSRTMFSNMGGYDDQKKRLNKERSAEYNNYIRTDGWYNQDQQGHRRRSVSQDFQSASQSNSKSYDDKLEAARKEEESYRRYNGPDMEPPQREDQRY